MTRKYPGGKKTVMAKIEKKEHRQVTFSKRKSSLFKKASELVTLCGAEAALTVFSPSGQPFSFGQPNVDALYDQFLGRIPSFVPGNNNQPSLIVQSLNERLAQVMKEKEEEEEKKEKYKMLEKERMNRSLSEALSMKRDLEDLKKEIDEVSALFSQTTIAPEGSSSSLAPGEVHGGNVYPNQDVFCPNPTMGINSSSIVPGTVVHGGNMYLNQNFFKQNQMDINHDPNVMFNPNYPTRFGYDHNMFGRAFPDNVMYRMPENNDDGSNPKPGV